jgi:hypothetical protein
MEESSTETKSSTKVYRITAVAFAAACSLALLNNSNGTGTQENNTNDHFHSSVAAGLGPNGRFHQSGLGGIFNINHPAGARARRKLSETNVIIPTSAVEHAIPSLSRENIANLHGHYVHDEHRSPFASFLYNGTKEELDAEQVDYVQRMNKIRQEWGAWDFNDEHPEIRPIANFDKIPYKDMMNKDFPEKAWQMDQKYVTDFISQSRKLVDRVREAIYSEYGLPSKGLNETEIKARDDLVRIHITEDPKAPPKGTDGWAFINKKGLEAYAKKLLHSMMTNDEFYYVMGGHSAAAGHGNNFPQTYMMEFANIMEPVLHKLGVRLITRNLAMGGYGTLHYSMGGSTLYGETDVMVWDSSMTEKDPADIDLFHKQVLLGGEKVPVLLGGDPYNLKVETGDKLWYGGILSGKSSLPVTADIDQVTELPWAVQYMSCDANVHELCGDKGNPNKYHATCWVPRSDYNPVKQGKVGGQASWHPGDRVHKFEARKQTMIMLPALEEAFNIWELGIEASGFPLKESYWHVKDVYVDSRGSLSNYLNNEGFNKTNCEQKFGAYTRSDGVLEGAGLDRACRMPLKGMTEFTPLNMGYHNMIIPHMKAAPNGYKPSRPKKVYDGIDVLPPFWKIPEGDVDVHAIALVSTYAPPELDQTWVDNDGEDVEEAEASRRSLRRAATDIIDFAASDDSYKKSGTAFRGDSRHVEISDDVIPGLGWSLDSKSTGYCDGSPMSADCKRTDHDCLLYGHNDARNVLSGDGLSGWLVIDVPDVKKGLIFAKIQVSTVFCLPLILCIFVSC